MESEQDAEELTSDQWLDVAAAAAKASDGEAMAEAIWKSGLPQLITFSLKRQHRAIGAVADAEFIAAGAVAKLYLKVARGEVVRNPRALMWTVAGRMAISYARKHPLGMTVAIHDDELGTSMAAIDFAARTDAEKTARTEAIRLLREYVAKMGAGRKVTQLWQILVDAIEDDSYLSRVDLANQLDITTNYVGVLRHRGKDQLEVMLRADGHIEAASALDEMMVDADADADADDDDDTDDDTDEDEADLDGDGAAAVGDENDDPNVEE
jgi:hypothetical protein